MMPVLFKVPLLGKEVPAFGVMMTIGFLLAIYWAARRALRSGANPDVVLNMGFIALIAGVVGCRAMFVIHYWEENFAPIEPLGARIWAIIDLTRGGMEFYGGMILTVLVVLAYLTLWKHSARWYLDIVAPSLALGMALGRVGCFLNGCCFGSPCDLPWAVRFPYGSTPAIEQWMQRAPGAALPAELIRQNTLGEPMPIRIQQLAASDAEIQAAFDQAAEVRRELEKTNAAAAAATGAEKARLENEAAQLKRRLAAMPHAELRDHLARYGLTLAQFRELAKHYPSLRIHPAQLYSTIGLAILAMALHQLYWRRKRDGTVIFTMLAIEPISRILLERIRDDNPHDVFGLTISQSIALGMSLVGIIGLLAIRKLPPRSPLAEIWVPDEEEVKGVKPAKA
jgi:phosphatidylglycerol:prolipoprotein diacylglycerol transferase